VTGGYAVTLKTASGTGISVPNGGTALLYCDGTNVVSGGGLGGDVVGPASATDTAIATFDGVTGKLIKNNASTTIAANIITALGFSGPLNGTVGATTPNTAAVTTLSATGAITSTLATGTAPLVVASTTKVANLNVDQLDGADWASPAAIGSTAPAGGAFTTLSYTGTLTGGTGIVNLGSGQVYKDASGNVGIGTSSPAAKLAVVGTGYSPTITITDGATLNWDTSLGQVAQVTLGGNRTFAAPTNLVNGGFYSLLIIQDGTGSRTISWNAVFDFAGGTAPTLSTAAGSKDLITWRSDGTNMLEVGRSLGVA
jgi:hypothetical protein